MPLFRRAVFSVALLGTVTSTIYCGMVVVAAVRFGLRRRREQSQPATYLPPVSVLKPLHGTEPGIERNIETFSSRTIRSLSCSSVLAMTTTRVCNSPGGWASVIRR